MELHRQVYVHIIYKVFRLANVRFDQLRHPLFTKLIARQLRELWLDIGGEEPTKRCRWWMHRRNSPWNNRSSQRLGVDRVADDGHGDQLRANRDRQDTALKDSS